MSHFQNWNERILVVCGNSNRIDLLRDQRVNHFDLALCRSLGRTCVDHFDVAKLLGSFLRTLVGSIKKADAESLDHQRDLDGLSLCRCSHSRKCEGGSRQQCFHLAHGISSLRALLFVLSSSVPVAVPTLIFPPCSRNGGFRVQRLRADFCHDQLHASVFQHALFALCDAVIGDDGRNAIQTAQDQA